MLSVPLFCLEIFALPKRRPPTRYVILLIPIACFVCLKNQKVSWVVFGLPNKATKLQWCQTLRKKISYLNSWARVTFNHKSTESDECSRIEQRKLIQLLGLLARWPCCSESLPLAGIACSRVHQSLLATSNQGWTRNCTEGAEHRTSWVCCGGNQQGLLWAHVQVASPTLEQISGSHPSTGNLLHWNSWHCWVGILV